MALHPAIRIKSQQLMPSLNNLFSLGSKKTIQPLQLLLTANHRLGRDQSDPIPIAATTSVSLPPAGSASVTGGGGSRRGVLCAATRLARSTRGRPGTHRVEVPFRTSHIMHLKASALFRKVQTLQSQ